MFFLPQSSGEKQNSDVVAPLLAVGLVFQVFNYSSFSKFGPKRGNLNPDYQLQLTADFEYIQAQLVGWGDGVRLGNAMKSRVIWTVKPMTQI